MSFSEVLFRSVRPFSGGLENDISEVFAIFWPVRACPKFCV